ncbi:MAG: histidinol dehydrogenase [Oscillospiraceae bacterium]|nr:histidinol dehydrogenase [Oscillospiraceae bacterium]
MIAYIKADGIAEKELFAKLKARAGETDARVEDVARKILADIKTRGDTALEEYSEKFDGGLPEKWVLDREDLRQYIDKCDPALIIALRNAAENIRAFHAKQAQQSWLTTGNDGTILGQRTRALKRVGIYAPGGTAAYPSSVLMNAIPAKVAGVRELVMVTPPPREWGIDHILAAAAIAGVDKVYLIGGVQAVGALAYGTQTVPQVDKIVGPGNIYVATAKKLVFGTVDIDMIAGPSEILVIADDTAKPEYVAADLLAQAEHDELASAILLTTSQRLADDVLAELKTQLEKLPRREFARKSLEDFGAIVVCNSIEDCIALADEFAPEHLELCVADPLSYIGKVDNAGAVFLGNNTPESVGDYYAGPNHVLPTGGTARFFSPLSVDTFLKKSSFIYYTKEALSAAAADVLTLAKSEQFQAHANAVAVRVS